jgi:uncharacterized protein involved in exopolysaccharide biosynthesis
MIPAAAGQPSARAVPRRVSLGPADVALYLWRAKWLMGAVFLPLFVCGMLAAMALPVRHAAEIRLLASPPDPGGRALTVQSELALLSSAPVASAAIKGLGARRLYPALADSCREPDCAQLVARAVLRDLSVSIAPGSDVIRAAFTHADPKIAEEYLEALLDAYSALRPQLIRPDIMPGLDASYARLEADLREAEAALRDYHAGKDEPPPDEDEMLRHLSSQVNAAILNNAGRLSEVHGQLAAHRQQIRSVPPEQDLFVEDAAGGRLQELYLERERWRASASPNAPALIELDREIERIETAQQSDSWPGGLRRRGVNPLYQQLQASILRLEAEAAALSRQQAELASQLSGIEARRRKSEPVPADLAVLVRQRDVAARALGALAQRDADLRVEAQLQGTASPPLRRLGEITLARRGERLRIWAATGAFLIALLAALGAGFAYVGSRRGLASALSLERTLGLPVLATVPVRNAGASRHA